MCIFVYYINFSVCTTLMVNCDLIKINYILDLSSMADSHVTTTKLYRVEEIPQDELNLQVHYIVSLV